MYHSVVCESNEEGEGGGRVEGAREVCEGVSTVR